jgi:SAM-dependent methyltransferase
MPKPLEIEAQPNPTLDLDTLMERLRAEVNERKRQDSTDLPDSGTAASRRHRIDTLLAMPDAEFIRAAYAAIFARKPTDAELAIGRDRLLSGEIGRTRLLREFLGSDEARKCGARIEGLRRREITDSLRQSVPAKWAMNVAHAARTIYLLPRRIGQFLKRVDAIERTAGETALKTNLMSGRVEEAIQALGRLDALEMAGRLNEANLRAIGQKLAEFMEALKAARDNNLAAQFAATDQAVSALHATLTDHWREIAGHKLALASLLAGARPGEIARHASFKDRLTEERNHLLDAFYVSFEDRFRGSREDIKSRLAVYLYRIKTCVQQTGSAGVVDIGCGRGEWLELLREADISAYGFDINRIALEENKMRGLDAREGDGLKAIAAMADETLSAITGFHIIEHLPFEALAGLIDQSLRVLRPGGMLLFETPNPANLLVAAERFYLDPTHRNPLPSELMSHLMQSRGFGNVEVVGLHPYPWASERSYDDPMLALLQDKLFGPQDYGVIGWKPQ